MTVKVPIVIPPDVDTPRELAAVLRRQRGPLSDDERADIIEWLEALGDGLEQHMRGDR